MKKTTRKRPINLKSHFKNKVSYRINNNIKLEFIPWLGKHDYIIKTEKVIFEQYMTVQLIFKRVEGFTIIMIILNQVLQLIEVCTNLKVDIAHMEVSKDSLLYKIPQTNKRNFYKYRIN